MTVPAVTSATARVSVERRWRAMGTEAQLIVVGVIETGAEAAIDRAAGLVTERLEDLAERAVGRIADLEGRWSRFLPTSEVSALNRTGWAVVSPETFALIDRAVLAWRRTGGRFDPTRLEALEHLGYDRSFDQLGPIGLPADPLVRRARPVSPSRAVDAGAPVVSLPTGCAGIVLEPFTRTVILPTASDRQGLGGTDNPTAGFDPGGIGKGYASDLVVEELLDAGAAGALLNLGGDLRVEGTPPSGRSWVVEVGEAAWAPEPVAVLELERGAVATSTPLRRRWGVTPSTGARSPSTDTRSPSGTAHHLLDPDTGRSTENGPVVVTAIAGEGWWAEAVATAVAATPVTDWSSRCPRLDGAAVAAVGRDGRIRLSGGFENFMRTTQSRPQAGPRSEKENERWNP